MSLCIETLLTPFRTIALEKYTGNEAVALNKLAHQMEELQESNAEKTKKILELESRIAPRSISQDDRIKILEKLKTSQWKKIAITSVLGDS